MANMSHYFIWKGKRLPNIGFEDDTLKFFLLLFS